MTFRGPAVLRSAWLPTAAWAGAVVLVTCVLYWPSLDAGFVGDDFMILRRLGGLSGPSQALRFFRGEFFEYYRPLGFLSHALDWTIAGAHPRQFHLTNLLLHAINSFLVLLLARALVMHSRCATGVDLPVPPGVTAGTRVQEAHEEQHTFRGGDAAQRASPMRHWSWRTRSSGLRKGRRLPPEWVAGPAAALLFALHASNHEAVVWVSARFDLLATCWALAAVLWMVSGARGSRWAPALLFLPAVLSKESTVALPIGAAAWAAVCLGSTTRDTIFRVAPWVIVLAGYALLRQMAGGVPGAGGAARAPKLIMFTAALVFLIWCADERWRRLRDWLQPHAHAVGVLLTGAVAVAAVGSVLPWEIAGAVAKEKLAVAGFALVYLIAPVTEVGTGAGYLQPLDEIYRRVAMAGLPAVLLATWMFRRRLANDERAWFLAALLVAALLPISALTEGRRYLYLPSAVFAVALGVGVAHLRGYWRSVALITLAVLLMVSSTRIAAKLQDWEWAGGMIAEGARVTDEALAPDCSGGHVVFLTSPVGVRSVYTHFYYETFEVLRGCIPQSFQIVARVLRVDTHVSAEWNGPDRIVITVPDYRGNLVISEDLRLFDVPLAELRTRTVQTPLGELRARAIGTTQRLILTLSPGHGPEPRVFFYFSDGRMNRLRDFPG